MTKLRYRRGPARRAAGTRLGLFAALAVTTIVYYLLLPVFGLQTAAAIRTAPWQSLGLGLAMLATTPLVVVLLFSSLLGIWLALAVLALYPALLVAGLLSGAPALADLGLVLARRPETPTRAWRIGSIAATFALLWLLCFVRGLGALSVFALLVLGCSRQRCGGAIARQPDRTRDRIFGLADYPAFLKHIMKR